MKCSNPDCNRGIGLISYHRGWFDKRRYCSKHCRYALAAEAQQKQKRPLHTVFVIAYIAFVGLILPATFAMALLAAAPARSEVKPLPGCDRNLAEATANVAAMQARIKNLTALNKSERCSATRLYFFELVKTRAVTALCKVGAERDQDLVRFDSDVAQANEAIAARCL
jgi:hypothetical protein